LALEAVVVLFEAMTVVASSVAKKYMAALASVAAEATTTATAATTSKAVKVTKAVTV
jgi:hypothetical protein